MSDFSSGDVVTVVAEEDPFYGDQGEVIGIFDDNHPEGSVEVRIEKERVFFQEDANFRFFPEGLEKSEWTISNMANRLFGRSMWHHAQAPKDSLNKEEGCMVKDCAKTQEKTGYMNCWGTVVAIHMCKQCHDKYNGMCTELLPL